MKTVFSKNLRAFIEHEGLRQQDVADRVGVTITSLSGWLNRGVQPRAAVIASIEEIYGLTDDDLFSEANGLYAKLHGLAPDAGEKRLPPPIPSKQASLPMMAASDREGRHGRMVELPASVAARHPSAFFVVPADGGMDLAFPAGCLVLVDPDDEPADGGVAAVAAEGGGCALRRVKRGASTLMLCPESRDPSYGDVVLSEGDGGCSIVGTAVWYQAAAEI